MLYKQKRGRFDASVAVLEEIGSSTLRRGGQKTFMEVN